MDIWFLQALNNRWGIEKKLGSLIGGVGHLECEVSLSPARVAKKAYEKTSLLVRQGFRVKKK